MSGRHAAQEAGPEKVAATYRLPADLHDALRTAAFGRRVSQNEIVEAALREALGVKADGHGGSHEKGDDAPGPGGE